MLVILVLGIMLLLQSRQKFGSTIDDRYVQWLSANAAPASSAAPLVLVEINDSSLGEKHAWPWAPLDYALFFQAILPQKPGVVAVEPVLDWDKKTVPGEGDPAQYETSLHNHLLSASKVVLGAQLGIPEDPDVLPPMLPVPFIRNVQGNKNEIPEFTDVASQPKETLRLAATLGFTNLPATGTAFRKFPLIFRYRGEVVPSFVLQAMMLWLQMAPEQISVVPGSHISLGDKTVIPIDQTGAMWVDFQTSFPRFAADELLLAVSLQKAKQSVDLPMGSIKDSITLLTRTDTASQVFSLPGNRKGSSGEIMAAAIATIQNKTFTRRIPFLFDLAALTALVALGWILSHKSKGTSAVLCIILLTLYLLGSMMVFQGGRVWLPVFMPVTLLLFALFYRLCGHSGGSDSGL